MRRLFSFCGFAKDGDELVCEIVCRCDAADVRAALPSGDIADDPGLVGCYPLDPADVHRLTGRAAVAAADWFVNATAEPATTA